MDRPLASVIRRAPHSRTCATLPGAAAEHPVELADPGAHAVVVPQGNVLERPGAIRRGDAPALAAHRARALLDELDPAAAGPQTVRARARLGARVPALLAAIDASVARRHPSTSFPFRPRGRGSAIAAGSSAARHRGSRPGARRSWDRRATPPRCPRPD